MKIENEAMGALKSRNVKDELCGVVKNESQ